MILHPLLSSNNLTYPEPQRLRSYCASCKEFEPFSGRSSEPVPEKPVYQAPVELNITEVVSDDLQPGGLAEAAVTTKKSAAAIESPLNGMSLKELKRMAEANNIPGANEMKKRDLIRALRDKVSTLINEDAPQVMSLRCQLPL